METEAVHPAPILIGVSVDVFEGRYRVRPAVAEAILAAGGLPVLMAPLLPAVKTYARTLDGFVLTGGDDPDTRPFGVPVHPSARLIDPDRQSFESALIATLAAPACIDRPVLGICLGMQMMGLHAGGVLDQHLPDALASADDHWGDRSHAVEGLLGSGIVCSHHRQAMADPGTYRVVASAPDGIIEAIDDPAHPFRLGVQWHPERTADPALGANLFQGLVQAAAEARSRRHRSGAVRPNLAG